jgi:peroxiredoxin 2/4
LNTPKNKGGIEGVKYGLIADLGGKIATQYDVLSSGGIAYRGLFLIDKEGVVRHQVINDLPLGRNVDEAIRMVDALQHNEKHGEVCPANWSKGGEAMKATHEGVSKYLSKH